MLLLFLIGSNCAAFLCCIFYLIKIEFGTKEFQDDVFVKIEMALNKIEELEILVKKELEDVSKKEDIKNFQIDLEKISKLQSRLKEDRFKSMREAFGGIKEEDN